MESFATTCLTCGRRLRIRSPELLGQIVACPKCSGMVQIPQTPPSPADDPAGEAPQIAVGPAGAVDSQAITQDSMGGEQLDASRLADPQQAGDSGVFNETALPAATDQAFAATAAAPAAGWQSDRTRRVRQIGMIATLAITGIVAATTAFIFFVQRWQQEQATNAPNPSVAAAETNPAGEAAPAAPDPATAPEDAAAPDTTAASEGAATPEAAGEATPPAAPEADPTTTPPADPASAAKPPEVREPAVPVNAPAPAASETATASMAAANDLMPETILGGLAEDPAAEQKPAPELPAGLRKYTSLLAVGGEGNDEEARLESPPTVAEVQIDQPAAEAETASGPAAPVRLERWLGFEVALEAKAAPLSQWARVLSQVSGVPIAVDIASLDAAGIAPTAAATPPAGWQSTEAVLAGIAASVGCQIRKTDSLVIVEAPTPAITAGLETALRADDLLGETSDIMARETLAALVKQVTQADEVAIAPSGEVSVQGGAGDQWITALTLEGLRKARQQPPRLAADRTARWLAFNDGFDWPRVTAQESLPPLDHPRPVIALVGQLAEANAASVVFAWSDLWQQGLTPQSRAMPWTHRVPGDDVLQQILRPYELQVRAMSEDLWWVGSQALYDRDRAVGLLQLPAEAGERVTRQLAQALGEENQEALPVAYDPAGGCLIAQLPRFLLRQLPALAETP